MAVYFRVSVAVSSKKPAGLILINIALSYKYIERVDTASPLLFRSLIFDREVLHIFYDIHSLGINF